MFPSVNVSYCQNWRLEPDGFKSLIVVFPTVNHGRIFLQAPRLAVEPKASFYCEILNIVYKLIKTLSVNLQFC